MRIALRRRKNFPPAIDSSVSAELFDEMDIFERYCGQRTYRMFSLFIAVPGANALYRKIFVTFSVLILSFATVFQVLLLVTDGFKLKTIVSLLPTTAAGFGSLVYVLYLTFATHLQFQYQCILSIMRHVLHQKRTREENAIREEYATNTKLFMNIYTAILIFMICGMMISAFVPSFLNVIIPLNYTRKNVLMYEGEIFVDQDKYFYYIYLHECFAIIVTGILVVVSVNMNVIIVQYSCSMSAILGYQLEHLTDIRISEEMSEKITYEQLLMRKLKMYIKSHQTIMELSVLIAEFYDIPVTLILIGTFCTLTMSLVQVTDPELISMKIIVYTVGQLIQLFLVSVMGQSLTEASLQTSQDAYNAEWDACPASVRKLLQMMILRASKPTLVMARGLYVLSIENFMSVMQTVTSFYMVLRNSQF